MSVTKTTFGDSLGFDTVPMQVEWNEIQVLEVLLQCESYTGLEFSVFMEDENRFLSPEMQNLAELQLSRRKRQTSWGPVLVEESEELSQSIYLMRIPGYEMTIGGVLLHGSSAACRYLFLSGEESDSKRWLAMHTGIRSDTAELLLLNCYHRLHDEQEVKAAKAAVTGLSDELLLVYEEHVALIELVQYVRPDVAPASLCEMVIRKAMKTLRSDACALVPIGNSTLSAMIQGDDSIHLEQIQDLLLKCQDRSRHRDVILHSSKFEMPKSSWSQPWNLVGVRMECNELGAFWLVLLSCRRGFGSEDVGVIRAIGQIIAAHQCMYRKMEEHEQGMLHLFEELTTAIDNRDPYTVGHSLRVATLSAQIAKLMGLNRQECETIRRSAILHDLGKIVIEEGLLGKPEMLSALEFRRIAQHPEVGYQLLKKVPFLEKELDGVRHHHERYDGKGYPCRLANESIPLSARIIAVADACDAMRSTRPYRPALSEEQVFSNLESGKGTQWDPHVIEVVIANWREICQTWQASMEAYAPDQVPTIHSNKQLLSR